MAQTMTQMTEDGEVEYGHDSIEFCSCGEQLIVSEEGIAYERHYLGTWVRHDCYDI